MSVQKIPLNSLLNRFYAVLIFTPCFSKTVTVLFPHLHLVLPSGIITFTFRNQNFKAFVVLPCVLHVPPFSPHFFTIIVTMLGEEYKE